MKDTAVRIGVCAATLVLLAGGCDSSKLGGNADGGADVTVIRLDVLPGTPDTRPGADQAVTPGSDARDAVAPGDLPPIGSPDTAPGTDVPVTRFDVPTAGPDAVIVMDVPPLPQPIDGGLACGNVGDVCASSADCCGLACVGGLCASTSCLSDGVSCTTGGQCCSTVCGAGGTCVPLNPTCKTAGNTCTSNGECCNGVCNAEHQCASPGDVSYCAQVGDICRGDTECCTGVCNIVAGAAAGTCAQISTACVVDGARCNGCGECCSHFCGPYGPGGPKICQPASGCRIQGDLCHNDIDCCGGDVTSALPGAGLVKCERDPVYGNRIGTCGGPVASNCPGNYDTCKNSCNPEGNVCHWTDTAVCEGATTSKRNDCCECISSKTCCQLDPTGIPRCKSDNRACVPVGGACAYSGDCCNHLPCVPDATGHLHCGATCVPQNGVCTTNADCCTGLLCHVTPGSLAGICTIPTTPPTNPDAGTRPDGAVLPPVDGAPPPDGELPPGEDALPPPADTLPPPVCALFGQACSVDVPCCDGVSCVNADFNVCTAADTSCVCYEGF